MEYHQDGRMAGVAHPAAYRYNMRIVSAQMFAGFSSLTAHFQLVVIAILVSFNKNQIARSHFSRICSGSVSFSVS